MSEPGDLEVTPLWNCAYALVHPAIGTVNGFAYIGCWVPCEVKDKKGHMVVKDVLYLVTSERETIRTSPSDELMSRQWRLECKPIQMKENRWTLADIQAYVRGAGVDPGEVFQEVVNLYKEYVELPTETHYILHALWSIGTYFHTLFHSYAYLYVGGIKKSGKTKTLTVHSVIDFNAIFSNNMSSATLYRIIQNSRATLLIDESEKLSNPQRAQEFRNILLSGYKKGPLTYRCGKDAKERQIPEGYDVYAPKGIANISGLEDVLEDRSIPGFQKRTRNKAIANKEVDLLDPRYVKLRGKLSILFLQYWKEISSLYAGMKDRELSELTACGERATDASIEGSEYVAGRELELWKPLYVMAQFFDKYPSVAHSQPSPHTLCSQIIELSCRLAKERHTENITEVGEEILIQCLLAIVPGDQLTTYVKVKHVAESIESQFDEKQEWLTTKWIGNALRRLGFTDKRRVGTGYEYSIPRKSLEDLAERMQIEQPKIPEKTIIKLERLTTHTEGKCALCIFTGPLDWRATLSDQTLQLLCASCGERLDEETEERA